MKIIIPFSCIILLIHLSGRLQAQAPRVVIDSNAVWKYWAASSAPNTNNWKGGGLFDDSAWPSGPAPLGYSPSGADGDSTTVATGCGVNVFNCAGKYPTIYFRHTFTIKNISDYEKFIIHYQRDDGIVIYVNGAEVKREFLPGGVISHTMSASAVSDESGWHVVSPDVSSDNVEKRIFLRTGTNVITAEVHQAGTNPPNPADPLTNSTDLRFGFWLEGIPATVAPQLKLVRGPYLQMGTTSSMTIRWRTEALSIGQVRYDTIATNLVVGNAQSKVVSESSLRSDHQIKLANLLPNRKYYYVIEVAGPPVTQLQGAATSSSQTYFYTAPLPGTARKTRIWALGDFGTDNARQDSVISSFRSFVQRKAISYIDLWLWMGDNAYDWGLDGQYQTNVFDKSKGRYDWLFPQTPFYATPGNHDYQNNVYGGGLRYEPHPIHYYDVVNNFTETADGGGGEPSHREEYYSFNYNNIHLVSLDSYGFENGQGTTIFGKDGPQVTWLKQDLTKAQENPAIQWIIAYWHHPPYTMGTYNSDREAELVNIRTKLLPILEQYKVDMVINGHSHVYERSRLMKNHFDSSSTFSLNVHNPFLAGNAQSSGRYDGSVNSCFYYKNSSSAVNEGVIYVVNGAGGRSGGTQTMGWPHKAMQSSMAEGGSMYIEVDGKRLDAKFVSASGSVKDQFTIIKDNDGFVIPPTDGTTRSAVCECTDNKGFTHYADSSGNLLLSIKKNGYSIGTAGVAPFSLKVGGSAGVKFINSNYPVNYVRLGTYGYRTLSSPWTVFNRYWAINPGTELTGNSQVIIRQYHKEADLVAAFDAVSTDRSDGPGALSLRPYKINDPTGTYTINPTGGHTNIPTAGAYNRPGAWIYSRRVDGTNGAYPTTHWYMRGTLSSGNYYSDYLVGRLKGGGGIGVSTALNSPNGNRDRASQMWDYLVSDTEPPAGWNNNQFYDARGGWERGYLPLGYSPNGEDGELTQIRNGCPSPNEFNTNCPTKTITTYFRGSLNYGGASYNYQSYILNYRRNDGVIIYIDGKEVLPRDPNMPSGTITPTTLATAVANEYEWRTVVLPASAVTSFFMAAELHQSSRGSNDLHLNIELIGSLDIAEAPLGLRVAAPVSDADISSLPTLYPNPVTQGKVFFSQPLNYQTLRLIDVQGKTYRYMSQPGTLTEFDVSGLPAGPYILTSQGEGTISRFKIVKQ